MEDNSFRLYITQGQDEPEHAHREVELVYILEGEGTVILTGDTFHLKKDDVILINSGKLHSWKYSQDSLVCRIYISYMLLSESIGRPYVSFWCNSAASGGNDVSSLRILLNSLIKEYAAGMGRSTFAYEAAKNLVLECLAEHFLLSGDERWNTISDERVQAVLEYVNANYADDISLEEAAASLYLSSAYLSRLFKQTMGMTFKDYVIRVRLNYAMENLAGTDKKIVDIAIECGFSNASVFNKIFHKQFHCTPTQYRQSRRTEFIGNNASDIGTESAAATSAAATAADGSFEITGTESGSRIIQDQDGLAHGSSQNPVAESLQEQATNERIQNWIQSLNPLRKSPENNRQEVFTLGDLPDSKQFQYQARSAAGISFGTPHDLLQAKVQAQLADLRSGAGFTYVRISGIFYRNTYIRMGEGSSHYNFSMIDQVLDYVTEIGMCPILDLTVMPYNVGRNVEDDVVYSRSSEYRHSSEYAVIREWLPFRDAADWGVLLQHFFSHLLDRYGLARLKTWLFELDESGMYHEVCQRYGYQEIPYTQLWQIAAVQLKQLGRDLKLGGEISILSGLERSSAMSPAVRLPAHMSPITGQETAVRGITGVPDFITSKIYPYSHYENEKDVYSVRNTDPDFVVHELLSLRSTLQQAGFPELPVCVTEWGTSVSERNAYNDTAAKAAHMAAQLSRLSSYDILFCYGQGSDYFSQFYDTEKPLTGGNGLLTKDGIRKPDYYVFSFYHRMQGTVLSQGEHHFAVRTESGDDYILLFNHKIFGHEYYLRPEKDVRIETLPVIFDDDEALTCKITIPDLSNGRYMIRREILNEETGSVLHNWQEMGAPERIHKDDVEYLKQVSRPRVIAEYKEPEEHTLELQVTLPAHEVQLLHIRQM